MRALLWLLAPLLAACAVTSRGMVVAPEPLAADAGAAVLREGGNAIDAAVCIGFVLAVTHPEAGNLGGGGFLLVHTARSDGLVDARETAPALATRTMYDGTGKEGSLVGPLASGVPGSVAGYLLALERWGSMDRARLLAPAIRLAEEGFLVDAGLARSLERNAALLRRFPTAAAVFLPGGRAPAAGTLLRQPALAATLRRIAEEGVDGFYRGRVAEEIERVSAASGGILTADDLAAYQPKVRRPLVGRYAGATVLTTPPPSSGGIALLQILAMLPPEEFAALPPVQRFHRFAEAGRRAFADRAAHLGDPDFVAVPMARLLDPIYLAQRKASIDPARATPEIAAGGTGGSAEGESTCHFSVVDSAGNAVACTTTLNGAYGCGAMAAGFLLNNEMDDFTTAPGKPNQYGLLQGENNAIAPGKRPLSSMTPTILLRDGRPVLVTGSPGGPTIISTVALIVLQISALGMDGRAAVGAPRIHHQWMPDEILHEPLPGALRAALAALGHTMRAKEGPMGDAQVVTRTPAGELEGASDPRGRGKAAW